MVKVVDLGGERRKRGLSALTNEDLLARAGQIAVLKENLAPADYDRQVREMTAELRKRRLTIDIIF